MDANKTSANETNLPADKVLIRDAVGDNAIANQVLHENEMDLKAEIMSAEMFLMTPTFPFLNLTNKPINTEDPDMWP
ncbi:MAG: hypothetical protein FWC95_05670 [Defluviitaleaceae bacterium]|nr:hypothetical protein [Defluviitaleaceae bacterium]